MVMEVCLEMAKTPDLKNYSKLLSGGKGLLASSLILTNKFMDQRETHAQFLPSTPLCRGKYHHSFHFKIPSPFSCDPLGYQQPRISKLVRDGPRSFKAPSGGPSLG